MIRPMALSLLSLATLQAHDFWIRPSQHRVEPGSLVKVHLKVGDAMKGEVVRRNPERMEALFAAGPKGEVPLPGLDGSDPAGLFRPADPGTYLVAYRGRPARLELEARKFEAYLREEGLDAVAAQRAREGATQRPGRERFSRCAKALVQVGDVSAGFDRDLGLRLEIIPEADPLALGRGQELPLRLRFEGKPLAHALVVARSEAHPDRPVSARTDGEGRVRLPLEDGGRWMVKTVHMLPLKGVADADWESLWASLSFDLR